MKDGVEVLGGGAEAATGTEDGATTRRGPRLLPPGGIPVEPPAVDPPLGKTPRKSPVEEAKELARRLEGEDDKASAGARGKGRRAPPKQRLIDGSEEKEEIDSGPDTPWRVFRDGGNLVVEFTKEAALFDFNKRQCVNLTGHMGVEARELPVISRHGEEAPDEIDYGADIRLADGVVRIEFNETTKRWVMTKLAAKLAIGEIRAKAAVLPSKSAG
jgi:hypothetical protein